MHRNGPIASYQDRCSHPPHTTQSRFARTRLQRRLSNHTIPMRVPLLCNDELAYTALKMGIAHICSADQHTARSGSPYMFDHTLSCLITCTRRTLTQKRQKEECIGNLNMNLSEQYGECPYLNAVCACSSSQRSGRPLLRREQQSGCQTIGPLRCLWRQPIERRLRIWLRVLYSSSSDPDHTQISDCSPLQYCFRNTWK